MENSNLADHWPICPECKEPYDFDPEEPFAYCLCGYTEWCDSGRPAPGVVKPVTNPSYRLSNNISEII